MSSTLTEVLKLNLGCKGTRIPGFKNLDIQPGEMVDFQGDVSDLSRFEAGSVDEIYASNILEHFPHPRTIPVLQEWARVLKKGGVLWLSVPDFECIFRLYRDHGMLTDWMLYHLFGEQQNPYQFHYVVFTWPRLRLVLDQAGFSSAERVESLPYGLDDASALRDNWSHQKISLNARAVK